MTVYAWKVVHLCKRLRLFLSIRRAAFPIGHEEKTRRVTFDEEAEQLGVVVAGQLLLQILERFANDRRTARLRIARAPRRLAAFSERAPRFVSRRHRRMRGYRPG
jgi:hypothetical protein